MSRQECFGRVFNVPSFRPGQKDNVTILIITTGSGKTLCFTLPALLRKGVTQLAQEIHYWQLQENGVKVVKYHGTGTGQNEAEGRQSLVDWQSGLKDNLVATKAAGAGLDKPDVRFVVHLGCPSSILDYLHESDRAG
ncbi:putative ATP-dependent DNA helicase Q1 [Branchiostoma floridae x Branchiostoma japonicum]